MSASEGFEPCTVQELIVSHASGPSPTCEERQVASSNEWGLLKTTAVTWSGWNPDAHKVPPRAYWNNGRLEVRSGDVIVTKAGPRNRCGVVVYVDKTPPQLMVSGKMIGLRPDPMKVDYRVLAAALSQHEPQRFIDSRTTGMADAQLNFTNELLLSTKLLLPPRREQAKIAEILSTLDRAIEQTEALIAKQQRIKTGLMQDLLTRGIDEQGNLRSEQTHQFKDSPLGRIPIEWDVASVGSVLDDITYGLTVRPKYVEEGVPLVSGKECRDGWIDYESCNKITKDDAKRLRARSIPAPGNILVTKTGTLGRVARIKPGDPSSVITQNVALLKPSLEKVTPEFLEAVLNSEKIQKDIRDGVTVLSIPDLQLGVLSKFFFAIPISLEEQKRIADAANIFRSTIEDGESQRRKLQSLKTSLMQDLLTGRKRVTPLLDADATEDAIHA